MLQPKKNCDLINCFLNDAGNHLHQVCGEVYLKVPKALTDSSYAPNSHMVYTIYASYSYITMIGLSKTPQDLQ